jgi:hypothetical protein
MYALRGREALDVEAAHRPGASALRRVQAGGERPLHGIDCRLAQLPPTDESLLVKRYVAEAERGHFIIRLAITLSMVLVSAAMTR